MGSFKHFTNGLIKENPTFRLLLGMCPTLAVTTSAINGLGMGLATTVVLIGSNVVISALRKIIPDKIRHHRILRNHCRHADEGLCAGSGCRAGDLYSSDCC